MLPICFDYIKRSQKRQGQRKENVTMAKKENWKHTNVLIEPTVYKKAKMLAVEKDTSLSELVYLMLKEAVENQK